MSNLIEVQFRFHMNNGFERKDFKKYLMTSKPYSRLCGCNLSLEFVERYKLDMENIKYSVEECKRERYYLCGSPLKVSVRRLQKQKETGGEIKEARCFYG